MSRVVITSTWSGIGGSTTAFVNLCNGLNDENVETLFIGPHDWHLGRCKGRQKELLDFDFQSSDIVIFHHFKSIPELNVKRKVVSIHELNFDCGGFENYDLIHFVCKKAYDFFKARIGNKKFFIAPCIVDEFKRNPKPSMLVAGVIGRIDENKQVHVSIERALDGGFGKILIYGQIFDYAYWNVKIRPYVLKYKGIIEYRGVENNKQMMYDSVTDVFCSSKSETGPLIKEESLRTGTRFHGNEATEGLEVLSKKEIIDIWRLNIF